MKLRKEMLVGSCQQQVTFPIELDLDEVERTFLLQYLIDIPAAFTTMQDRLSPYHSVKFEPFQVTGRISSIVTMLRDLGRPVQLFDTMSIRVMIDAFENNPFFLRIPDSNTEFIAHAIRRTDVLRRKLTITFGRKIGPVPLRQNRRRAVSA
jgi:hypothetical protein